MGLARELLISGGKEYRNGKFAQAERLYRLAVQAAIDEDDPALQYVALLWEAISIRLQGGVRRALSRCLDMRLMEQDRPDIAFPTYEAWLCRKIAYKCQYTNPISLAQLQESLDDLVHYSRNHLVPPQDIFVLKADLCWGRGIWHEAATHLEAALANNSRLGSNSIDFADTAAHVALRLHRFDSARDCIARMRDTVGPMFSNEFICVGQDLARFELARAEGDQDAMRHHLHGIMAAPAEIDGYLDQVREARVWGALFDTASGDPAASDHPARRALSRAPKTRENLHALLGYTILVLDYRLACLRHIVGLPQNDDQWHPAVLPNAVSPSDRHEALRRLSRARIAASGAQRRAAYLDDVFECDWRQEDIGKRTKAIDAIANILYFSTKSKKS